MRRGVLHVDTAATWRGGQNQVLLTARGMAARGDERRDRLPRGRRARGPRARGRRGGAAPALPRRPLAARDPRARPPPAPRAAGSAACSTTRTRVSAGLVAARLAGRVPLVAVRRVDFPLRGPFSRAKYAACDRVIVVSRAIGAVVERGGVLPARLRLVYEGVPDRAPAPGGREALEALGVPAGVPVVGNVAALTGHKDHATLVEAMALLRPRCPEARLVIAGEGELRPALEALVRERGLGDRVVFAGFRHDLDRLLPAFSVFCLSSRLEGLGTSLLDAMAFGLPVVATAAGGIPEAVEDGVTGRVAPPRDPAALAEALADVLGDEERRRAYGAAGRRRFLERFTADHMVDETLRVLEEVA